MVLSHSREGERTIALGERQKDMGAMQVESRSRADKKGED